MKLMKKVLAVALSGVMALSMLTACGDSESYHSIVDKLGDGYSYSDTNSTTASTIYKLLKLEAGALNDYTEDMKEIGADDEDDEKLQKKNSADVAYDRNNVEDQLIGICEDVLNGNYVFGVIPVSGKNASEDAVVAAIKKDLGSTTGGKIGFFIDQDFSDKTVDINGWTKDFTAMIKENPTKYVSKTDGVYSIDRYLAFDNYVKEYSNVTYVVYVISE